jgi:hypothetical protein
MVRELAENLERVRRAGLLKYVDLETMGVRQCKYQGRRDVFWG